MSRSFFILSIIVLAIAFMLGFINSHSTGIQPGYFEKAEAPAYGVGGEEVIGKGLSEEYQKHLEKLYQSIEE